VRLPIWGDGQGLGALAAPNSTPPSPAQCPRSRADGGPGMAITRSLRPDGLVRVTGNVQHVCCRRDPRCPRLLPDESAIRPVRVR
jgi:hypothetical protein